MKRWIAAVAAVGLVVGIAGPVAAKAVGPKSSKSVVVSAPKADKAPSAPLTGAQPVVPKHHGGGYPGPNLPTVKVDPSTPRRGDRFKVKVEYFCVRGTVTLTLSPTRVGWPKTFSTNRYGKGETYISGGIPTRGNYTVTATCSTFSASKSFRVK